LLESLTSAILGGGLSTDFGDRFVALLRSVKLPSVAGKLQDSSTGASSQRPEPDC